MVVLVLLSTTFRLADGGACRPPSTAPCTSEASSVVHGAVRGSARARLSPPRSKPCSPARVSRYCGSRRTWGPAGPFLSVLTRSPPSSLLIQDAWSTPPSSPRPPDRQVAEEKVATEPNAVVSAASSRGRGSRGASHEASASEEHCPGPPPAEARWDSELVGASSLRLPRSVRSVQQPGAVVMALMSPEGLLAIPSGKSPDCTASVTLLGFEVDPSNASCTAVLSSASDRLRPLLGAKVGSRSVAGGTPSSFIQFVEQLSGDEMGFNGVSLILAVSPFLSSLERIRSPGELGRRVWGPDSASGVLFGCPLETLGDTPAYPLAGLALQCLQILRARRLPADPPPPSPSRVSATGPSGARSASLRGLRRTPAVLPFSRCRPRTRTTNTSRSAPSGWAPQHIRL